MNVVLTILVGFISGWLSGTFGVGGGILTTPAMRLVLGSSAGMAVGTPLFVNVPSAIVGAYNYNKNGLVLWNVVRDFSALGLPGVIMGSLITGIVDPRIIMLVTSIVIFWVSTKFLRAEKAVDISKKAPDSVCYRYGIGFFVGLFSGFLGLGGGLILVPVVNLILKEDIKKAFGTSLATIVIYGVPGTLIHYYLGHVDFLLAALLIAGVMPGAFASSLLVPKLRSDRLRFSFGLFLVFIAVYFAVFELSDLSRNL